MANEEGFSAPQACRLVGITYRQIDYWDRSKLQCPSLRQTRGTGSPRRYSYRDLVALKVIRRLLDGGIALAKIRTVVQFLATQLGEDLASASLVFNSSESLLVHHEGELVDVLCHGQGVMSVVALAELADELDGAITSLAAPTSSLGAVAADRVSA